MKKMMILFFTISVLFTACGLPKETAAEPIAGSNTATTDSIQALQPIGDIVEPAATLGACPLAQYRDLTVCTP